MTLIRPRNYRPPQPPRIPAEAPAATGRTSLPLRPQPAPAEPPPPALPPAAKPAVPSTEPLAEALTKALGTRFQVLRSIAIGGMAVLFQLRHQRTNGLFVAKIMRPELRGERALREAFTREARTGAQLAGHPNAVAILDLDEARLDTGNTPYLLMPYIDGEDLDHVLERGRLGRDEALMLLAQLGSLLMYAETEGLVHADIALGNIRLDRFGQYRLLDYGLARGSGDSLDALRALAGTPAYNSPEQLHGQRLDIRSDLYSLGLVFFHALTGQPAFNTTDLDQLARAHLQGSWRLPEEFAGDLPVAALLGSLLAVDREQRMSSAFELSGAMAALGYELPSFLRSLPGASATPRLRRRRLQALPFNRSAT